MPKTPTWTNNRVVGGETGKCDVTEGNPISLSRSKQY